MNFLEAVKAMKKGKNVSRASFSKGVSVTIDDVRLFWNDGEIFTVDARDVEADDWEIVEDKKTLYDKKHEVSQCGDYHEKDRSYWTNIRKTKST